MDHQLQEKPTFMEMDNIYTKPSFQDQPPPNLYDNPAEVVQRKPIEGGSEKNSQKLSFTIKLLIAACVTNFVLIILIGAILSVVLSKTATKSEVNAISQGLEADRFPSTFSKNLPGPPGNLGVMDYQDCQAQQDYPV